MTISPNQAAMIIRVATVKKNISLGRISRETGIQRPHISHFLMRSIDLRPNDINQIFKALNLDYQVEE